MEKQAKIAVIGGGSWATALVKLLTINANELYWWMRNEVAVQHIQKFHHNPNYLSSVEHDLGVVKVSTDLTAVVKACDVLVLAVPSAFLDASLEGADLDLKRKIIFSAIKGIEPRTNMIIGEYLHEEHHVPKANLGIIAGPCHAEEVALERLSYLTIAHKKEEHAAFLAKALSTRYLKTKTSDDVLGAEYAAVLKNVYAVASGICHGVGYGDNFQAILISNAIREMKGFVDLVYPMHRDIKNSAYLGDLLVTAYSQFSRNRSFGTMVGKGYTVRSAQLEMKMVAEGYYASRCMHLINESYQVDMPIMEAVYRILHEKMTPLVEIRLLSDKLN